MPDARVVDLAGDLDWAEFEIPAGSLPARIVTLHVERPSRARTLLVRFPEGFRREAAGWYECAEELVVLQGGLEMTGETYGPGDWAWIPAGAARKATAALPSMLALARFDGPARWTEGEAPSTEPISRARLNGSARVLRRGAPESAWRTVPPSGIASRDTELLAMSSRTWARVEAGATFPRLDGPCFCRTFPTGGEST